MIGEIGNLFLFWMVTMDCGLLNWVDIGKLVPLKGMIVQCSLILCLQSVMVGRKSTCFLLE